MMPEERCPYCGSEEITYMSTRLDYGEDALVETAFCQCESYKKKINIEVDYIPSERHYYNPSTCGLLKSEVFSNE